MGMRRWVLLLTTLLASGAGSAYDQAAVQRSDKVAEGQPEVINASRIMLPCTPVGAYWSGPPPSAETTAGPQLAVVSIKVRPKNARVHLDGRFVGRAKYLDGRPGYLYVEPGSYTLELQLEGYRTVAVELDAEAACRFDLKYRLERGQSTSTVGSEATFGKGRPLNRIYGPIRSDEPADGTKRTSGPDPSLRKDLADRFGATGVKPRKAGASLKLRVNPPSASVLVDGAFVATARELGLMEKPLATTAGKHEIAVRAPGYIDVTKSVELAEGEILELEITLSENPTD